MKLTIKGKEWEMILMTNAAYCKKFGEDSAAITVIDKRKVYFNKHLIRIGYVRHELLHVLLSECNTESANLSPVQIEEVCASIIEEYWNNINFWVEQIMNSLTEVKDHGKTKLNSRRH